MHNNLQYFHCTYTDVNTVLFLKLDLTWNDDITTAWLFATNYGWLCSIALFCLPVSNTAATTQFLSAEGSEGVGHFPARGALLVELLSSKFPHQQKAYYIWPQWHQMEPISLASTVSHYVEGSVSVGKSIANHNKVSLLIRTLKYSCNFIFGICSNPFQPLARCYMSNMISDSLPPFGWRASLFLSEERKKSLERNRPPQNGVIWRRVTERRTSTFTVTYFLTDPAQGKWRLCNRMCNLQ